MAYYFAVETEENSFNAINIKRCRNYFNTTNNYDGPFACTLKEINKITTTFANEQELKKMLLRIFSINETEINKKLAIFYIEGKERRLLKGKVLYEDSRFLLEEPANVIEYIKRKAEENDYVFFKELAKTYSDDSKCNFEILKIASLLEGTIINDEEHIQISSLINEILKKLLNDTEIKTSGTIIYKNIINYEKLHVLVSFISDYELSLKNNKTNKKIKTIKNTSNLK